VSLKRCILAIGTKALTVLEDKWCERSQMMALFAGRAPPSRHPQTPSADWSAAYARRTATRTSGLKLAKLQFNTKAQLSPIVPKHCQAFRLTRLYTQCLPSSAHLPPQALKPPLQPPHPRDQPSQRAETMHKISFRAYGANT
jgi:hypothetical protein